MVRWGELGIYLGLEKGVLKVGGEPNWLGDGRRSGFGSELHWP